MKNIIQEKYVIKLKTWYFQILEIEMYNLLLVFIDNKGDITNRAKNGELFISITLWKGNLFLWSFFMKGNFHLSFLCYKHFQKGPNLASNHLLSSSN